MPTTSFSPTTHGFHFANNFANAILTVPVPGGSKTFSTYGRCGGMAYASLDYFWNRMAVPTHSSRPSPTAKLLGIDDFPGSSSATAGVPPDSSPLAQYIYKRLKDSIELYAAKWLEWSGTPDSDTFAPTFDFTTSHEVNRRTAKGVISQTKEDEWPKLKQHIDAGNPVPIGLLANASGPAALPASHVVVAYGYEENGNDLVVHVYDNNHPDLMMTLSSTADNTNPHWNEGPESPDSTEIWRGFFVEDRYAPEKPSYLDFALSSGLTCNQLNNALTCSFTVQNVGVHPAHAQFLFISVKDSSGTDSVSPPAVDPADPPHLTVAPAETRGFTRTDWIPNLQPGPYSVTAHLQTLQADLETIAEQSGTSALTQIEILPPLAVTVSVREVIPMVLLEQHPVGAYSVFLSAAGLGFSPSAFIWNVEESTGSITNASGNTASLLLRVGATPGPFTYEYHIHVQASDNSGNHISTVYVLELPQPAVTLAPLYDASQSHVGAEQTTDSQFLTTQRVAYSSVVVAANLTGLFRPLTLTWTPPAPKLASLIDHGDEAVFKPDLTGPANQIGSYRGFQVNLSVTDAVGQTATAWLDLNPVILRFFGNSHAFNMQFPVSLTEAIAVSLAAVTLAGSAVSQRVASSLNTQGLRSSD